MAKHDPEQQPNLDRVTSRIEWTIVDFVRERAGSTFYMSELLAHVQGCGEAVAPDSPGRILRSLRQRKQLDYKVVNRASSLYQAIAVTAPEPT